MNKEELKNVLQSEKKLYMKNSSRADIFIQSIQRKRRYETWQFIRNFRKAMYWRQKTSHNFAEKTIKKLIYICFIKKSNLYASRVNAQIVADSVIGKNLMLCHAGTVINGIVGENCVFHGNNIVGNKGIGRENERPVIGNNVDIGAGAVIIGNVEIADNCVIGANSVVVKSFLNKGAIIVGNPAREIHI